MDKVFNPSDKKGGTLKIANAGDWDSLDPGETYYGYSWNFARLYGRSLIDVQVGARARPATSWSPDLAEGLGKRQRRRQDLDLQAAQGPEVRGRHPDHVQGREVRRRAVHSTRRPSPTARRTSTTARPGRRATRARTSTKGMNTDSAIETPDDQTIVFHLKTAVRRLRLPRAARRRPIPVPQAKDTGAKYKEHLDLLAARTSSRTYEPGKGFNAGPQRPVGPGDRPEPQGAAGRLSSQLNVNADDIDNRIIAGDLDVDVAGTGVQPAALAGCSTTRRSRRSADNPTLARLWYTSINPHGEAVRQHPLPQGRRVRHGPDVLPDRLRRPVRRWRPRDDDPAAADPGLPEVRPVPDARTTRVTSTKAKEALTAVRPAQRLRDQHRLPRRAAEGEGDRRGVPAGAGQGRHQADAQGLPAGRLLLDATPATRRTS